MYPFDSSSEFFNRKPKLLQDKAIPEFLVSLKISKKHIETAELRDRIIKEAVDELTIFFAHSSREVSFPEYMVPIGVYLRKFKKSCKNPAYCKMVAGLLDALKKNEDFIYKKRAELKDVNFVSNFGDLQNFGSANIGSEVTPLEAEKVKIEKRRQDQINQKTATSKKQQ
jgi:hypothetical protein